AEDPERSRPRHPSQHAERGADVVLLLPASAVAPARRPDPPEIEPQRRQVGFGADLRGAHDHGVVHVAAVEGVRVAQDESGGGRGRSPPTSTAAPAARKRRALSADSVSWSGQRWWSPSPTGRASGRVSSAALTRAPGPEPARGRSGSSGTLVPPSRAPSARHSSP